MNTKKSLGQVVGEIFTDGFSELDCGFYIQDRKSIIEMQKRLGELDGSKNQDFSGPYFWITDDNGMKPIGLSSFKEIARFLKILARRRSC